MARDWKPFVSLAYATVAALVIMTQLTGVPNWAGALLAPLPVLLISAFKESGVSKATEAWTADWRSFWQLLYVGVAAVLVVSQTQDVIEWTLLLLAPISNLMASAIQEDAKTKTKAS